MQNGERQCDCPFSVKYIYINMKTEPSTNHFKTVNIKRAQFTMYIKNTKCCILHILCKSMRAFFLQCSKVGILFWPNMFTSQIQLSKQTCPEEPITFTTGWLNLPSQPVMLIHSIIHIHTLKHNVTCGLNVTQFNVTAGLIQAFHTVLCHSCKDTSYIKTDCYSVLQ